MKSALISYLPRTGAETREQPAASMEGGASTALSIPSPKTHFPLNLLFSSSSPSPRTTHLLPLHPKPFSTRRIPPLTSNSLGPPPSAVAEALETEVEPQALDKELSRRIDKSGRFCSPRASRELALVIAYAACLEGADPVRLFDKRVNAKKYPGYEFDKAALLEYDHMSFGGAPVNAGTEEEAEELMLKNEKESANEVEVLSAPPKLVYNKFVLSMARDILKAVVERWDQHVLIIDKITPSNWKDEPAAKILELCILHQAMAEMTVIGTRHQIVINEAVDLAKRFCDGCAPRVVNGCLRTFVKDHISNQEAQH